MDPLSGSSKNIFESDNEILPRISSYPPYKTIKELWANHTNMGFYIWNSDSKHRNQASFIVLFLTIIVGVYLYSNDLTLVRDEIRNPILLFLSFAAVVLVHDTYFYFTHLLMHKNRFLLKAHMWHHKAHNPTPLSVFSFHPIEAFIHFVFFIFLLYLPIHYSVIFAFYIWMLLCNAFGHMNFEFYSIKILKFKITRDFNTATHHYMHHKYFKKNFGIYYNH